MKYLFAILLFTITLEIFSQIPAEFKEGDYIFYCTTFSDPMQVYQVGEGEFPNLWEYGIPYCVAAFDLIDTSHTYISEGLPLIYSAQDIYDRNIWALQNDKARQPIRSDQEILFDGGRFLEVQFHKGKYLKKIKFNAGKRLFFFLLIDPNKQKA